MSDSDALFMILGGSILLMVILMIAFYVLLAIALWKIFAKFGEPGWKAWIPFYNLYIQFKYTWKTSMFWAFLILVVVGGVIAGMGSSSEPGAAFYIGCIIEIVGYVIMLVDEYKLYKVFGHGAGWFILSIFFPNIITLVLGFGSSKYQGLEGQTQE